MNLGQKIRTARQRANLTERQLGEAVGFTHPAESAIRRWESGEREPRISALRKIAQAVGMSLGGLTELEALPGEDRKAKRGRPADPACEKAAKAQARALLHMQREKKRPGRPPKKG